MASQTSLDSFLRKCDLSGGPESCWIWIGYISRRYGTISMNNRPVRSNRASWILHNGPIPDAMFVCHHCDNPLCCNPSHLFLGTVHDNNRDMKQKNRHAFGSRTAGVILQYDEVDEIRDALKIEYRGIGASLARKYNVSEATISAIKHGRNWKWRIDNLLDAP